MYNAREHYNALMTLCEGDSPFYYVDQELDGVAYRIFSYRLAGYQEFCLPYARECRGHMFEVNGDGEFVRLASFPMQKFFNLNENPFTMDLDFSNVNLILDKEDGSLISSFLHCPSFTASTPMKFSLQLKSKTSVSSAQANAALQFLRKNFALYDFVEMLTNNDYTVNMEYMAPDNRIVIPHQETMLRILNVRNNANGEYIEHNSLVALAHTYGVAQYIVINHVNKYENYPEFIKQIPDMKDIEGFVVFTGTEIVKIKTDWYVSLHRAKDSVNSPKALFGVVVAEAHDDLRAAFSDDAWVLSRIAEMEVLVQDIYKKIKHNVEGFYNTNKHLDRKSYAILAQHEVPKLYFSLAMNLYLGKENDYKDWMLKHYKDFGIKDELENSDG